MLELQTQVQFKNILVATDFSPVAAAAFPFAARLAQAYGSKIWAFHVAAPTVNPMTDPSSWAVLEEAAKTRREEQRRILSDSFPGFKPEIVIEEGDFSSILESTIKAHNVDLIVVATHGRAAAGKFLLGSVAEEILRTARCPVLTVNAHAAVSPNRKTEITRILLATSLRPESLEAAAPYAIALAQELQTDLTLLHVIEDRKPGDLVDWPELREASMQLLKKALPREAVRRFSADCVVEQGDAATKILTVAEARHADLIVLGAHEARGIGGAASHLPNSAVHKVISQAHCPVLTVRT
jgi:nucleotide-binding universal stress UspA family protein